jgi:ribonuclease E
MSDDVTPEAGAASRESAAAQLPVPDSPGPAPPGNGQGAARRRRRRGSRGGRNRRRPPGSQAAVTAADTGEDHHDAGADRGLTTEDVAADARQEAGLAEAPGDEGEARPAAGTRQRSRSGSASGTGRRPAPAPPEVIAEAGEESVPVAGAATRAAGRGSRSRPATAARAEAPAKPQPPAAPDEDGEPAAPARRRRRRGRGGGGGQSQTQAAPPVRAGKDRAETERLLDDLDEAAQERRKGRTRKGRPTGRYLMCVHVREGHGIQVAVLEGRSLVEHYVSRPTDTTTAIDGNIYLGKVQNVLPGMEAAFVDIGTPKNGVLYRDDVAFDTSEIEGSRPRIERMLRNGQSVVVQVTKNPIGTKGARLTQEVSLAGRFVVMIPDHPGTYGISKRLADDERKRLRRILDDIRPPDAGLIVRTAAEGASADELSRDLRRLQAQWNEISGKAAKGKPARLLYQEPDLAIRVIREEFNKEYRGVVIDDRELYEEVRSYVEAITPELADRVELYDDPLPIFERYHVHEQLHKALERKVWLPSGGSIVIERTEALTVIDVNTSKNVGRSNLEETVFQNNLEAAEEVARQLRLRDIGGIIVIDFIDMEIKKNREEVLRTFKDALARDKTRTQVFDISELGLVEMTRKRISEGLVEAFSTTCPTCEGRGIVLDETLL